MKDELPVIIFIIITFSLFGCSQANRQNSVQVVESANSSAADQKTQNEAAPQSRMVDFKDVSFNYNPQVFSEIKQEEIAATPMLFETDKPGGEYPKHVSFTLKTPGQEDGATLKIIPIEDWKKMYTIAKGYIKALDENIDDVKKITKDKNFRIHDGLRDSQIPYVPFIDASQLFHAKIKGSPFQNGKGFFFLTEYVQDSYMLVSNDDLTYIFQGISNDGKYYIWGEFPVTVSFLPKEGYGTEFEGYKLPDGKTVTDADKKSYEDYMTKITLKLENLEPDKFTPNLNAIEEIISSLKVEN